MSEADRQKEIAQLEACWALTSPLWRCAHCGDRITGEGITWVGPVPLPGQDSADVPRYHLGRNECRAAYGLPPMRPMTDAGEGSA